MNQEKKAFLAYRCPECGNAIDFHINIFQLSGKGFELVCPECGSSKITITLTGEGKVRLNVPCLACPHPHPYTVSSEIFFSRDLFAFQCSFTGMDICFVGNEYNVLEAMEDNDRMLEEMMDEEDGEDNGDGNNNQREGSFANSIIMFEALNIVRERFEAGEVKCNCEKTKTADISVQVSYDRISLKCKKCGAQAELPAKSEKELNNLIDLEEIVLS